MRQKAQKRNQKGYFRISKGLKPNIPTLSDLVPEITQESDCLCQHPTKYHTYLKLNAWMVQLKFLHGTIVLRERIKALSKVSSEIRR